MKNLLKITIGGATLIAASGLTITESAQSYSTLGFSLGLSQRDLRLYDNFNDSASNNNTTAHANWPGYTGAELALWKSAAEWGADAFGDGSGDSTQGIVGSGGANYNPVWNGNASGQTYGNNIISAPDISGGGAIAWMFGGANGWTIEFIDNDFTFADGPGSINGGQMDIQGVGTHEFGHSVGLGHSNVNGATMYPSIGYGDTRTRSIAGDDKDGVQAVYGVQDAAMPFIDDITGSFSPGGTAVVHGGNFTATDNRLWFNSDVLGGGNTGGAVYKLNGLSSSNGGTQISFTVPSSGIESGGVNAKVAGGKESLGEGHPFELGAGGPGTDLISLSGPTSATAGNNVSYTFTNATPGLTWQFHYSFSNAGHVDAGHSFDLGLPIKLVGTGTISGAGSGSLTKRLPGNAGGLTVYLEVRTLGTGFFEDSNMITLQIL
jgi:matrixin